MLLSLIMIIIVSTSRIRKETDNYCTILIQLSIAMISYDIIFFIFHTGVSQITGKYVKFLVFINAIGFLCKLILLISFIVIKVKNKKENQVLLK
jgi:hypothetical protein